MATNRAIVCKSPDPFGAKYTNINFLSIVAFIFVLYINQALIMIFSLRIFYFEMASYAKHFGLSLMVNDTIFAGKCLLPDTCNQLSYH